MNLDHSLGITKRICSEIRRGVPINLLESLNSRQSIWITGLLESVVLNGSFRNCHGRQDLCFDCFAQIYGQRLSRRVGIHLILCLLISTFLVFLDPLSRHVFHARLRRLRIGGLGAHLRDVEGHVKRLGSILKGLYVIVVHVLILVICNGWHLLSQPAANDQLLQILIILRKSVHLVGIIKKLVPQLLV